MKNPYNPVTEPSSYKWFEEKPKSEPKDINVPQWDWYGWLCARIPVLKESANKFWIHQCVEDLLKFKALSNPLEQSEKKEEWVSCKDRLPEATGKCLIFAPMPDNEDVIMETDFNKKDGTFRSFNNFVTYWHTLPPPPKNLV